METDKEWLTRVHNTHDAERGPVTTWVMRARHPGGRWRQVARIERAASPDETYAAVCREAASVAEPHVEVQAYTARSRQPESTRAPWTAAVQGDAGGAVPDIDTDADPATVAMQFAASARAGYEHERKQLMEMWAREIAHLRAEAEHWRGIAFQLTGKIGPAAESIVQAQATAPDHAPLVGQVIGGIQSLGAMALAAATGQVGAPLMMCVRAFFDSLNAEQLQHIANVLTPQQQAQLLVIADLVHSQDPKAQTHEPAQH